MSARNPDLLPFEGFLTGKRRLHDVLSVYYRRLALALIWLVSLLAIFAFAPMLFLFILALHPVRTIVGLLVVLAIFLYQLNLWIKSA